MKRHEELDRYVTPSGEVLTLVHHDGDYSILIDGEELMGTRQVHSESELARRTCADLQVKRPRVLIGGLGLGYTLRAALDVLPRSADVVVAEKFECVVRWNHHYVPNLQGNALRDRRVEIAQKDVWEVLSGADNDSGFDVIMLDVDNGPNAPCFDKNARLYGPRGLARIKRSLRPNGLLAIWATDPDRSFERRLRRAEFDAETQMVRSRGTRGARHYLFLGRPRAGSGSGTDRPKRATRQRRR